MTLNYAQIRNLDFNPLLTKLLQSKMPYAHSKRLVDLLYVIRDHQAKSDELWQLLSDKFKDVSDLKPATEELNQELHEFLNTPVEINQPGISEKALENLELSGQDILLLRGLIED